MNISLRQLEVFDAVASLGSIARAAEKLNMSASAASTALKDLQRSLDRPPLFRRVGRGIRITSEGMRLQSRIRALLREVEDLQNPSSETELSGTIIVGASDTGTYLLPPLATSFRVLHPDVRIDIVVGPSQDIVARLGSYSIDMVLTDSMTRAPGTHLTEIYRERSVLIAAPQNPLCRADALGFEHLESAEWCMPGRSTITNQTLNNALRGHIANLRVAMEINSDVGVREAVKSNGGISCLPLSLVAGDLDNGRLVELNVTGFSVVRPTYLVRMKDVKSAPAVQAFERHLLENFPDLQS